MKGNGSLQMAKFFEGGWKGAVFYAIMYTMPNFASAMESIIIHNILEIMWMVPLRGGRLDGDFLGSLDN